MKARKPKRSAQSLWLLQARCADGSVWLEKRPPSGIWGGLHCLPVFDSRQALSEALPARTRERLRDDAPFLHVLTHRDLHLHPVAAQLAANAMRGRPGAWFASGEWAQLGLPAPIRRLLQEHSARSP